MTQKRGFTLIELLVVIAIIGILATIVLAAVNSATSRARDAQRKSDLHQASIALELYFAAHGTYIVAGTGSSGGGNGWFSYIGGAYPKTVARGLVDDGTITKEIVDPSGVRTTSAAHSGYMINATATHYTLWANLENPSAEDIATQNTCNSNAYDNYSPTFPAAARMNYCISN